MEKHHCIMHVKIKVPLKKVLFIQLNIMKNLNDIMKHCVLKKKEQEGVKRKKEEGVKKKKEEGVKRKKEEGVKREKEGARRT